MGRSITFSILPFFQVLSPFFHFQFCEHGTDCPVLLFNLLRKIPGKCNGIFIPPARDGFKAELSLTFSPSFVRSEHLCAVPQVKHSPRLAFGLPSLWVRHAFTAPYFFVELSAPVLAFFYRFSSPRVPSSPVSVHFLSFCLRLAFSLPLRLLDTTSTLPSRSKLSM